MKEKLSIGHKNKSIVLFDGVCNLCNASVDFLIRIDKKEKLYFSSLQSDTGQKILTHYQLSKDNYDSFLYLDKGKLYQKSSAGLHLLSGLGGFWTLTKILFIFPKIIRDLVYTFIAKNRYRFFGKKETCRLPTKEEKKRFI